MEDRFNQFRDKWGTSRNKYYFLEIIIGLFAGISASIVFSSVDKGFYRELCGGIIASGVLLIPLGIFIGLGSCYSKNIFVDANMIAKDRINDSTSVYDAAAKAYYQNAIPAMFASATSIFVIRINNTLSNFWGSLLISVLVLTPFVIAGMLFLNAETTDGINGRFGIVVIFVILPTLGGFYEFYEPWLQKLYNIIVFITS